jgi:deoxyxylulose-5-phosphate synthase
LSFISVCLLLLGLTGTLASHGGMVHYDFLKLYPQLVCQALQSKATLNQLLDTSRSRDACKKLRLPHSRPNSTPTGEEGKQIGKLVHRHAGPWAQQEHLP